MGGLLFFQICPVAGELEQGSFLVLNNPMNSGFFAVFNSVLGTLDAYEKGIYAGLEINLNTGLYLDPHKGTNWWTYFFEPIYLGEKGTAYIYMDFL
jgi:hypothetical protein